jgi:molybdopterin synthase sulfur carrier subunit
MKITVKLYAMLGTYLPPAAKENQLEIDVEQDAVISGVLAGLGVPGEACHLVLVNGVYVEPSARDTYALKDGDALAAWPPVAGG